MSYLRNGQRIFSARDKAKQFSRRGYDSYSTENIYRRADRQFKLSEKNIRLQHETWLRQSTLCDVRDQIRWIQCNIAQRRYEMLQTMQFCHDHIMRESVSASGSYADRRAWLYWSQCELKFMVTAAQRFGIDTSWL